MSAGARPRIGARVRKLLRMGPAEIAFRARHLLGDLLDERLRRFQGDGRVPLRAAPGSPPPRSLIGPEEREPIQRLARSRPGAVEGVLRLAEEVCAHRLTFFGRSFELGREIRWGADPVSGREWPRRFHSRIGIFGDSGHGDVKYVWELNRHQFLPALAKAYWLTDDERYAAECVGLIRSWIRANPWKFGINWTSALEVAVRGLSWCTALGLLQGSAALANAPEARGELLRSVYQHGRYLQSHLSVYFSPYNHLIGEAAGLHALGTLFPELKPAPRWAAKGWEILERELPRQFHPDGGTVEQAIGYHHFTLGFYLQAVLLRRRNQGDIPRPMMALLERAFEFSLHLSRPDGEVPRIGDGDEGKALDLDQATPWDFRPYLAVGAVLFGRGDLKRAAGEFPLDALWLLGADGFRLYQELPAAEPRERSVTFPASGYCLQRTGWDRSAHYLCFDCGEIAAGVTPGDAPSAAHGHADPLAVEVSAFGTPVLVDAGFFTYNGDLEWHRYFREAAAHNTLVVDGRSPVEFAGRMTWRRAPEVRLRAAGSSGPLEYAEGEVAFPDALGRPLRLRRAVALVAGEYWLLHDEVAGAGERSLDRYFHFAPTEIGREDSTLSVWSRNAGGGNLLIRPLEGLGAELAVIAGGDAPSGGWLGTRYDGRVPAPVVRYRVRAPLPAALDTLLWPFREPPDPPSVVSLRASASGTAPARGYRIDRGRTSDIILTSPGDGEAALLEPALSTDARLVIARRDAEEGWRWFVLVEGSALKLEGRTVARARGRTPLFAVSVEGGSPAVKAPAGVEVEVAARLDRR